MKRKPDSTSLFAKIIDESCQEVQKMLFMGSPSFIRFVVRTTISMACALSGF